MQLPTVNAARRTAIVPDAVPAPRQFAPAARAVVALSLAVGLLLPAAQVAQAGWTDWLSPSDSQSQPAKRTVKKAGIRQPTKRPTTAAGRMLDSVTSAPKKMMTSSMGAMLPGKKPTSAKSRTVPRKLVSEKSQPSMLQRLFTTPQKDKPLTVTEWMAQPRPKP
ncbi:MAG TPA: hypothetical protein VHY91_26495 [Pirellulales bacterium]|jgi:hypothetical protein|nr:hypothetical protein [Pirellulales bacterium]